MARIGAKLEFGGKKISNILKFSRRHFPRQVAAKWRQVAPSGAKWHQVGDYWHLLALTASQVEFSGASQGDLHRRKQALTGAGPVDSELTRNSAPQQATTRQR